VSELPFLKKRGIARLRRMSGESKYGYSEDDEIIEQILVEMFTSLEAKDPAMLRNSIKALISIIKKEESHGSDAQ